MTDFPDEDVESQSDRYKYVKAIPGCICTCTTDENGKYQMDSACPRHCPRLFADQVEEERRMYGTEI